MSKSEGAAGRETPRSCFVFLSDGCRPAAGLWAYPRRLRGFPHPGFSPGGRGEPQVVAPHVMGASTRPAARPRTGTSRVDPFSGAGWGEYRHSGERRGLVWLVIFWRRTHPLSGRHGAARCGPSALASDRDVRERWDSAVGTLGTPRLQRCNVPIQVSDPCFQIPDEGKRSFLHPSVSNPLSWSCLPSPKGQTKFA